MNTQTARETIRVTVRNLLPGDIIITGETIHANYATSKTHKGYRHIVLAKQNGTHQAKHWRASTTIHVTR